MNAPLITAHSGCEGTERDSLESVRRAIDLGADAVEVDVRMDPDGVLCLSHEKLHSASQYAGHTTLENVFALLAPTSLSINCDVKEREHLYELLSLAQRYGFDKSRLILSGSVSPEQLVYDPSIIDRVTLFMNIEELFKYLYLSKGESSIGDFSRLMTEPWEFTRIYMKHFDAHVPAVVEFARHLGVSVIIFPHQYLCEEHYAALQAGGLSVSVWTVDDRNALKRILAFSVSNVKNITTRQVVMAQGLLQTHKQESLNPLYMKDPKARA